ncbi:chromate efflux transporter [Frigidibacter mobilis]|uniref:Chromate transporter n=1 Tax=Frigidibacter mobilis TaxID=1335048 RepID=A0A159Z4C9_9RHOB|nr:chromate efflux transporter [Frigidibacter mobilis]AMY69110.1 chromate transporter [Frigidibacter mobilis]
MSALPEIARTFLKLGLVSFGGPAAHIALMHRVLVDERRWLTEAEFLRALSLCMLLPGPEATQLATWAGWRRGGVAGGAIAGALFVLPGAAVILVLAAGYVAFGQAPAVAALFLGVKAAVVAIVLQALLRVGRRALTGRAQRLVALAAFLGIFALGLPFPLILALAAVWGALFVRVALEPAPAPVAAPRPTGGAVLACLALWAGPLALLWAIGAEFLLAIGLFFSKLALLTFGGAYAVLAWMVDAVAMDRGWVTTAQMMDALGLAETTPGPLILVTEFVGFVAGHAQGGWGLGLAAGLLVLWVTFLPSFLFIFALAPFMERLTSAPRLAGALQGVTAAVVGVIGNLAAIFALHVLFGPFGKGPLALPAPDWAAFDPGAALIAAGAGGLLLGLRWPLGAVLALSALAGLALSAV